MSQEKVNRYKEEKANRKKIMKREKIKKVILSISGSVVGICLVVWLGYSGYNFFRTQKTENPTKTEIDLSAATDYLDTLFVDESADAE